MRMNAAAPAPPRTWPNAAALLFAVAITLALATIATTIPAIIRFRDIVPFGDMIDVAYRYFTGPARDFWIYHDNEHLPLIAMPFYWIDLNLFRAQGIFLTACNLLLAAAIGLAPARALFRATPGRVLLPAAVTATLLASSLWLGNSVNLVWTKQVHMYLSLFAVMAAIGITSRERPRTARHICAITFWLAIATFSFGYGIVGFPAILAIGLLRGWNRRALAAIALAGLVCLAVYAAIALPLRNAQLAAFFMSLGQHSSRPVFALTFIASPPFNILRHFMPRKLAFGIGWLLAILGLAAFCRHAFAQRLNRASELRCWATALTVFTVLVAAETAYARAPMFNYEAAADGRYIIAQLPFWAGLLLLATEATASGSPGARSALGAVLAVVCAGLLASGSRTMPELRAHNDERWSSAMAAIDHVADPRAQFRDDLFYPGRVAVMTDAFRARRWSVFDWPQAAWIGRPLASFGATQGGCAGHLDNVQLVGPDRGWRLTGWAADRLGSTWILLVDPAGTVRGLAHGGGGRPDLAAGLHNPHLLYAGWTGYVPFSVGGRSVAAYLLVKDKHPCRIAAPP